MKQRIISALVLLPIVCAAIWYGYPYFEILLGVAAVILAWEWDKMLSNRLSTFALANAAVAVFAMMVVKDALSLLIVSTLVFLVSLVTYAKAKKRGEPHALLKACGLPYITAFTVSAVFIENTFGNLFVFWLILIVFASDTGGMLFGKTIKGPKLCPSISPNKTWAGFFGGIFLSVLIAWGAGRLFNLAPSALLVFFGAVLAIIGIAGDLLESKIKRVVGVKDSSNIIPGHGGMFDRIDSLMLVMIVVAIFTTITTHIAGV